MDTSEGSPARQLAGSTWHATALDDVAPVPSHTPEITFDPDGSLFGSTGVNRLRGSYSVTDDRLAIRRVATTMMAASPAAMAQEQVVLRLLEQTLTVTLDGDVLRLDGPAGATTWARGEVPALL